MEKQVVHLFTESEVYAKGSIYDPCINRTAKFFMRFDSKAQALSHLSSIRDDDDGCEFQLVIHSKV